MNIPHPIPYQGSKRNLAREILACFPNDVERLIEPFAGSAAISLAAAYHRKAEHFILNDINAPLMKLWGNIIDEPDTLALKYKKLWEDQQGHERQHYNMIREQFNIMHRPDHFLYLLARCVKASIRYNSLGEFNQSPDHRRRGAAPETMKGNILGASQLLQGKTKIVCGDYHNALERATMHDIIYMDPPYQGVCSDRDARYIVGLDIADFTDTLRVLNNKEISYIVSYDGRTNAKIYGKPMPDDLELTRIEVDAGRSSQATLLGRSDRTYESIYLAPALMRRIDKLPAALLRRPQKQLSLFEVGR